MSNVLVRNTQARVFVFQGRDSNGSVKAIRITPSANATAFLEIPREDWNLVKDSPQVIHFINQGHLVVRDGVVLVGDETSEKAFIENKPIAGDALVKGKEAVKSEIERMLEAGDFEAIAKKYPAMAESMQGKIDEAAAASTEDDTDGDNGSDELPGNVDELLDSLDGKSADDIKKALREYGKAKYDMSFGNSGVDTMIGKIKEIESDTDGD